MHEIQVSVGQVLDRRVAEAGKPKEVIDRVWKDLRGWLAVFRRI